MATIKEAVTVILVLGLILILSLAAKMAYDKGKETSVTLRNPFCKDTDMDFNKMSSLFSEKIIKKDCDGAFMLYYENEKCFKIEDVIKKSGVTPEQLKSCNYEDGMEKRHSG